MGFEQDFQRFIQVYNSASFQYLARPGQMLSAHVRNMLSTAMNYLSRREKLAGTMKFISWGACLSILSHDIGKIIPHFQYKIIAAEKGYASVPANLLKYSHHTLIGAYFASIIIDAAANVALRVNDRSLFPFEGDELTFLRYLVVQAVICHHSRYLLDDYDLIFSIWDPEELTTLFSPLQDVHQDPMNQLMRAICDFDPETIDACSTLLCLPGSKVKEFLESCLHESYVVFSKTLVAPQADGIFSGTRKDTLKQKINIKDRWKDSGFSNGPDGYFIEICIASVLCDVDIWDARFFDATSPRGEHHIPFFEPGTLPGIAGGLVKRYVESSFSMNKSPSWQIGIIDTMRNGLFKEVDSIDLQPHQIYIINAPTGAGKTLALLNCAHKVAEKIRDKTKVEAQIIYALPFVSIGTQVASQIEKLYPPRDKNGASTPLLTVDNYITPNCWSFDYHNDENNMLKGHDAKWLISSWRSRYVVTTFVKLFHTLLKPIKANYLRLHRLPHTIIILDEIQCLPIEYWALINHVLKVLVTTFQCTLFLSTATQPAILEEGDGTNIAKTFMDLPVQTGTVKKSLKYALNRYELRFFDREIGLTSFLDCFIQYLRRNDDKDVLLVVNTKKAAIHAYTTILEAGLKNTELFLLSTLVLPLDRTRNIAKIKHDIETRNYIRRNHCETHSMPKRLIVVSTQVIEAGVDLSFEIVFRDFAPLDSIVQVAGRCNRSMEYERGIVYIFLLQNDLTQGGMPFFHYVYTLNNVLDITSRYLKKAGHVVEGVAGDPEFAAFGDYYEINEPGIRDEFNEYFHEIKTSNNYRVLNSALMNVEFEILAEQFEMIKKYPDHVYLLFLIDDESREIHEKIRKARFNLSTKFFLHTISIKQREAESLLAKGVLQKQVQADEVLYYYIDRPYIDKFYLPRSGFINNLEVEDDIV